MLTEEESLKWFNNLISDVAKEIIITTNKNKDKLDRLIIVTWKSQRFVQSISIEDAACQMFGAWIGGGELGEFYKQLF